MDEVHVFNEMDAMMDAPRENRLDHLSATHPLALIEEFFQMVHGCADFQTLLQSAARFFQKRGGDPSIDLDHWKQFLACFSSALAMPRPGGTSFLAQQKLNEPPDHLQIANALLRENEWRFRQMFESTSETFWLADAGPHKRILYIAPSCKYVLGVAQEEVYLTPRKCFSMVHKADRKKVWECYKNIKDGRLGPHEYRIIRPDGSIRWVRNEGWPLNRDDKEPMGMTGVLHDVTGCKRLKEELIQISEHEKRHLMEELKDGICQHLAGTSLVCKVLYNKMIARNDPVAHDMARICRLVTTAVTEARQLSESLGSVTSRDGSLAAALTRLSLRTSSLFSISCIFRGGGEEVAIPDETTATHLYGIAKEAVNNAVRCGGAGKIRIRLRRKGDRILLLISDNGTGFTEPSGKRTGIGLRMMEYRATESGGQFKVERGKHGGTVVTCSVPVTME